MEGAWRVQLVKCRKELVDDLSFDMVSACLIERKIIHPADYTDIRYGFWFSVNLESICFLINY